MPSLCELDNDAERRSASMSEVSGASERKTGVKRAEVVTVRLVQDERGWLRLAG
jgi:hypothetical protein